ncbi:Gx transporter family protein [Clostridium formicaceticum]|uniref:Heptaprenyl diphosphate synthase n=1 Tax=Clostridium formicaceticum TaxID=1497 RepID=A0AAC9RL52_9CLOT|nr:Gx transporter family protein [Clostridium formicaceticum]AOY76847.1 heptaprenyl diphosphate synthase [Clostridium formicaceticum]ARE87325.1 Heptaprenyl diphosphate synthase component I [Clostridium formicaceticum]
MNTKKLVHLSILVSLGLALHIMEGFIPNPFIVIAPGAKLGLANIIGLITLVIYGIKYALTVNLLRAFIAGMASGAVTSMIYSIAGAVVSTLMMWMVYKLFKKYFSLIGVSVFGAVGHNIAQLTVAAIIINNIRIYIYLPIMMLASIFTGIFIGLTANFTLKKIKVHF